MWRKEDKCFKMGKNVSEIGQMVKNGQIMWQKEDKCFKMHQKVAERGQMF